MTIPTSNWTLFNVKAKFIAQSFRPPWKPNVFNSIFFSVGSVSRNCFPISWEQKRDKLPETFVENWKPNFCYLIEWKSMNWLESHWILCGNSLLEYLRQNSDVSDGSWAHKIYGICSAFLHSINLQFYRSPLNITLTRTYSPSLK